MLAEGLLGGGWRKGRKRLRAPAKRAVREPVVALLG